LEELGDQPLSSSLITLITKIDNHPDWSAWCATLVALSWFLDQKHFMLSDDDDATVNGTHLTFSNCTAKVFALLLATSQSSVTSCFHKEVCPISNSNQTLIW